MPLECGILIRKRKNNKMDGIIIIIVGRAFDSDYLNMKIVRGTGIFVFEPACISMVTSTKELRKTLI